MLDDNRKLGLGFCGLGMFLIILGILLLFDRALLTLGNLTFVAGLSVVLGLNKLTRFFFKPDKLKGTFFYFGGLAVIILKSTIIGFILQILGLFYLFNSFLPNIVSYIKLSPISFILDLPGIKQIAEWIYDQRRLPL
ncbi:Got1-like family protein [Cryptosporidium serpentis]